MKRPSVEKLELPPLPGGRAFHTGAPLPDGRVVLVGGNVESIRPTRSGACITECSSICDVAVVDIARRDVQAWPPLERARQWAWATVVDRTVVVAGGLADYG